MRKKYAATAILCSAALLGMAACSGGSQSGQSGSAGNGDPNTLTIAYQKTAAFHQLENMLEKAKTEFEASHEGITVNMQPIEADQDQYFTKLALMNGSPSTAPDVIYEDTFQVMPDAEAGYLYPMDEFLDQWEDWDQFDKSAQQAGVATDGKTYGVSLGTDTRALYFHKDVFKEAGLPEDWQPKNWDEILDAARTIKQKADAIPLAIYGGKAAGEASTMQGFEMLLYGTDDTLYDEESQKWITGSKGFRDALGFYKTVTDEELGLPLDIALESSVGDKTSHELLPAGKVGIVMDGSWAPGSWIEGEQEWDEWADKIGFAKMPTQNGQKPGFTSMSGGWLLSIGGSTANPQAAFDFISIATNMENSKLYDTTESQIAVRRDVQEDPEYLNYNESFEFFSGLVQYTHFRPATPDYSQISSNIQVATESMVTGEATPEQAAEQYDQALIGIVGEENTQAAQ